MDRKRKIVDNSSQADLAPAAWRRPRVRKNETETKRKIGTNPII